MIKYNPYSRRHFLIGMGGFALAIPVLPSLLTKKAIADLAENNRQKPRFIFIECGVNGGLRYSNWYPTASNLIQQASPLYRVDGYGNPSEHFIRSGPIELTDGKISPIWDEKFAPLKDKMNFLRGLDVMFSMVHHQGILGNYNATNTKIPLKALPSVDQVIAFLRDKLSAVEPVMNIGPYTGAARSSFLVMGSVTNPSSVPQARVPAPYKLFESLFERNLSSEQTSKEFVVDKVLTSFNDIMKSAFGDGNKLGKEDRTKLDEHIAILHDIQTRVKTDRTFECSTSLSKPDTSTSVTFNRVNIASRLRMLNDIVIAAFKCDASRIATYRTMAGSEGTPLIGDSGESHNGFHDISHTCHWKEDFQRLALDAKKYVVDHVIYDLVNKLNEHTDASNGLTMLDNSLVLVTDESNMVSHHNISQPCVTFGSAGGFFNTGRYIDYRNRNSRFSALSDKTPDVEDKENHSGVPWNRFLATILQSMGIDPEAFEQKDQFGNVSVRGYGDPYIEPGTVGKDRRMAYLHQLNDMSNILPLLKKT